VLSLSLEKLRLSLSHFRRVRDVSGLGLDGQVRGSYPEAVDWVRYIGSTLDKTISVDVAVSSLSDAIVGFSLVLGRWATGVSVGVLAEFILSVVLAGNVANDSRSSSDGDRSVGYSDGSRADSDGGVSDCDRGVGNSDVSWSGTNGNGGMERSDRDGSSKSSISSGGGGVSSLGFFDSNVVGNLSLSDFGSVIDGHGGFGSGDRGSRLGGSFSRGGVSFGLLVHLRLGRGGGLDDSSVIGLNISLDNRGRCGRSSSDGSGGCGDDSGSGGYKSRSSGDESGGSGDEGGGSGDESGGGSWGSREVSCGDTETVERVGDVRGTLDEAVAVDVGVSSPGHSVSSLDFVLGRGAAGVAVGVLAEFVLSVVLGSDVGGWDDVALGKTNGHQSDDGVVHVEEVRCCLGGT